MDQDIEKLARTLLKRGWNDLPAREQRVLRRIAKRVAISENVNEAFRDELSVGQRMADRVAAFGGSWTFIILFAIVLIAWVLLNTTMLSMAKIFDPYPFIFLNLILSMLAAVQAPVIMMSQNRQSAKDRLTASHDYEVNLKAELEIMSLHNKLDEMRSQEIGSLLAQQATQLSDLRHLLERVERIEPKSRGQV